MNMISTGAFLNEMDASNKQSTVAEKFVSVWEKKNAKAARAGGVSLMALSLAACGSSSTTTTTTTTDTSTTTTTATDAAKTLKLTARDDSGADFTGGSGADLFDAYSVSGSLTNGDSLVGGDGADTLAAHGITGTIAATTSGIETVEVRGSGGSSSLTMTNMADVATVVNDQSTGNFAFTKVAAGVAFDVRGTGANNTTVTLADATGSADTLSVAVKGDNGDLVFDGVETLTITSAATHGASTGASFDLVDSDTLKTINVTSTAALDLGVVSTDGTGSDDAEYITVNATGATGGLTLDVSHFDGTSAGAASVGNTVTLGAGDDTLKIDIADISKYDTYTAGDGTDTLHILDEYSDAGSSKAAMVGVTGFENLHLGAGTEAKGGSTTQLSLTDAEGLSWVKKIIMSSDTDNDLLDVPDDFVFEVQKSTTVNQIVTVSFEAGIIDTTLNLKGGATLADADITNSGVLTINSTGSAANAVTAITGSTAPKFVITGNAELDINDAALATTTLEVDGSAMTGALHVETSAKATKVTGGSGADTLNGGAKADTISGGAGNDTILGDEEADVIDGGAGNDTITAMVHASKNDTITTGEGTDTVILEDHSTSLATAFGATTIKDFDFGTSSTTVDTLKIANSMIEAGDLGGTITGALVDTSTNDAAAGDGTVVHITADGQTVVNADIVVLSQTYATAAAALTGMSTAGLDTFSFGAALTDDDIIMVAFSDGTDSHIAVVTPDVASGSAAANSTSDSFDAIDVFVTFDGVASLANFDSGDVQIIA